MAETEQSSAIPPITGSLTVQQHLQVGGAPSDTTLPTALLSVRGNFSHPVGQVNIDAGDHEIKSADGTDLFKDFPKELLVYIESELNDNHILLVTKTSDSTLTLERPYAIEQSDFDVPLFINPPTLFSITNGATGKNAAEFLSVDSRGNVTINGKLNGVTASDVGAIPNTTGAVGSVNLATNAVTSGKIEDHAVSETQLDTAVAQKLNRTFTAADIGALSTSPGAVGSTNLAANAVTSGKIAAQAVTTDKLAVGSVEGAQLAADAVTADKLAPGIFSSFEGLVNYGIDYEIPRESWVKGSAANDAGMFYISTPTIEESPSDLTVLRAIFKVRGTTDGRWTDMADPLQWKISDAGQYFDNSVSLNTWKILTMGGDVIGTIYVSLKGDALHPAPSYIFMSFDGATVPEAVTAIRIEAAITAIRTYNFPTYVSRKSTITD